VSDDFRDPLDRALAAGLHAIAPDTDASETTLAALRPGLHRARVRARAVRVTIIATAFVLSGSVAALAAPSSRGGHVRVAATTTVPPTAAATLPTTTVEGHRATTTTTLAPAGVLPAAHPPAPAPIRVPSGPVVTPAGPGTHHSPGGPPSVTPPNVPATTTTTAAPNPIHTYESPGGTITVRFARGALTLVSDPPAPGYTVEIHDEQADEIEVRFHSLNGEWRIRVRAENGALVPEITQH
jgi:hypothetical protein